MLSRPVACPKPRRAVIRKRLKPVQQERRAKQLARIQAERDAKEKVRERDQGCRWPGCQCAVTYSLWSAQECAHVKSKSLGGDNVTSNLIQLCKWWHQGPYGLHSGLAKIEPLTTQGTDGPCEFWRRAKGGQWYSVGRG